VHKNDRGVVLQHDMQRPGRYALTANRIAGEAAEIEHVFDVPDIPNRQGAAPNDLVGIVRIDAAV